MLRTELLASQNANRVGHQTVSSDTRSSIDIPKGVRGVLLDIEGTTSSISFVHDVMFPFVREHLSDFLHRRWHSAAEMDKVREQMARDDGQADWDGGCKPAVSNPSRPWRLVSNASCNGWMPTPKSLAHSLQGLILGKRLSKRSLAFACLSRRSASHCKVAASRG